MGILDKTEFEDLGIDIWKRLFQKYEYASPKYMEKDMSRKNGKWKD